MSKEEKTRSFRCARCRMVVELSYWSGWPQPNQAGDCPRTANAEHNWSPL